MYGRDEFKLMSAEESTANKHSYKENKYLEFIYKYKNEK